MADCFITGSATIVSNSFGNPTQNVLLCENTDPKIIAVTSSLPKNDSGPIFIRQNTEKIVFTGESLTGKPQTVTSDALIPLSNPRSTDIIHDSSNKGGSGARSVGSGVDLGVFLFPGAVNDVPGNISEGSVPPLVSSAFKNSPLVSGLADFQGNKLGSNIPSPVAVSGSAPDSGGSSSAPVANKFSEGSPPAFGLPSGSVNPVCAADLRRAVSPEVWARFPETVWKDAAVIASEILKLPPPVGSPGSTIPLVGKGMDPLIPSNNSFNAAPDAVLTGTSVIPPVPPVVKPVTPSDSSAKGPDPEAPSFAALVTKKNVEIERIGSTDFSGPLPTAVFTKE
ncbi:hypothetical protein OROMI_010480 [Orobanche minor]